MKIVIEIDDARFKDIRRIACVQLENYHFKTVEQIIANGTLLPKGHGRLIDADKIGLTNFECFMCGGDYKEGLKMLIHKIETAPTIIEADRESEVEE